MNSNLEEGIAEAAVEVTPLGTRHSLNGVDVVRFTWIARTAREPRSFDEVQSIAESARAAAARTMTEVHERLALRDVESSAFSVEIRSFDGCYWVVLIDIAEGELQLLPARLMVAGAALRVLDIEFWIQDLQGIPRKYWYLILGPERTALDRPETFGK